MLQKPLITIQQQVYKQTKIKKCCPPWQNLMRKTLQATAKQLLRARKVPVLEQLRLWQATFLFHNILQNQTGK